MTLTPTQLTALKTDIEANTDPVVVQALADGNNNGIADWYNLDVVPDYFIYRNYVSNQEVRDAINLQNIADITDNDRARVETLLMIRESTAFSGAVASDRSAWNDVFSAAAGDESQQAIAALWTRLGTNAEKVFSLGTGSGADVANADTTSFQGLLCLRDIRDALAS